jgi:site-specific DNA-methyltransferase (adenine-specific)
VNFKKVFISELSPAKYNPRKDLVSSDPEYQRIKRSIEEFGYVDPIIVNSDYTVIGGHQRLKVLKELGHAQIDVVVVDIPKDKEKALNIALNKITGEWDTQRLTDLLGELKADGMDISITGFDEKEFDGLLRELHKDDEPLDTEPQISRAEELRKEWGTEVGQLWELGTSYICPKCGKRHYL